MNSLERITALDKKYLNVSLHKNPSLTTSKLAKKNKFDYSTIVQHGKKFQKLNALIPHAFFQKNKEYCYY